MSDRGRRISFIIITAFLVFVGYLLLRGGPNHVQTVTPTNKPIKLTDYINSDSRVQLTINGRINSNELHRVIKISVAQNERTIDIYQGYENNILNSQRYDNNPAAYDSFMQAINLSGFAKPRRTALKSELGVCPLGFRYVYELFDNSNRKQRSWSATCNAGSFGGNINLINALFQKQIPDYASLTGKVEL